MSETINNNRLFIASCVALVATSMTFSIRANLIGTLGAEFNIPATEMGIVFGTAFWGFTLSMIIGGALCDRIGMHRLLIFAFTGHIAGIILTILATGFWSLFISTLLIGIGNGFVEAACNPLVSSMYPKEKTKRLNQFHVWFPGGIVIGGLAAYFLEKMNFGWQIQVASILVPALSYGLLFFNQKFPPTERVSKGVSSGEMIKECLRPLFIIMALLMMLTACTELGTNQWIVELLGSVGVPAILLLVFINGLMAIGRSFAGTIEHKLSPPGMLLFSAIFSTAGLLLLSQAQGYMTFVAAAIFAIGICYFWPTMLGFVSEYIPKTGALGLSVMGAAGMIFVSFAMPYIGGFYEQQQLINLPQGYSMELLKNTTVPTELAILTKVNLSAGTTTLKYIAIIPAFLSIAFGILYIKMKKKPVMHL
jgi:fucose permease